MPLSTVLGAQSLVQPAVCTTATRPASPYTGQAIYDTTISALLIWSGTAWTGTGGLQLVTTATCSSGGTAVGGVVTIGSAVSSVTVSSAFSATYENYKIVVSGGTSSAIVTIGLQLGSTTTGYYGSFVRYDYAGTASTSTDNNAASFTRFGFGNTDGLIGVCDLFTPQLAKNTFLNGGMAYSATTNGAGAYHAYLANTTQYTAFTLTPAGGTLTGGTIRVYGYSNS